MRITIDFNSQQMNKNNSSVYHEKNIVNNDFILQFNLSVLPLDAHISFDRTV